MPRTKLKRDVEAIDLTGDSDDENAARQAPLKPRLSQNSTASTTAEESENDDEEADGFVPSQEALDQAFANFQLYGTLGGKIVGVRYYNGYATIGEMVVLQREPHNQYDANAISVQNVHRQPIGHIPRGIAAKLAKYMDSRDLLVEGHVTGPKGLFECPIALKLYGTSDPLEQARLKDRLQADRLPLDEYRRREQAEKQKHKEALAAQKKARGNRQVQAPNGPTEFAGNQAGSFTPSQNIDEIVGESERFNPRNVEQFVEKFSASEEMLANMPMAEQPADVQSRLLPFQLQGLKWLLDKESPVLPPVGSRDVVQLWKRNEKDQSLLTNIATNFSVRNDAPLASGGILADDMGLGKTVQIIALIAADKALRKSAGAGAGPTLIICPLTVMSNWTGQIEHHMSKENPLKVIVHHGPHRVKSSVDIKDVDVVVTTYGTVTTDHFGSKSSKKASSNASFGLSSIAWRRIVLDEGHEIRNPASKKAAAVSALNAASRWALTGTPIVNTLKDLYSIARFLRLTGGLDRYELFNAAIIRPVNQGSEDANVILQLLMNSICLRRRKEMSFVDLKLPPLSAYIHRVNFEPHEQEKYDALAHEAKGTLDKYKTRSGGSGKGANAAYQHLLEVILRLRQMCNHWKLCGKRITDLMAALEEKGTVDLTPENLQALQDLLQMSISNQEDCPICLETLKEPVITTCAHIFCNGCIERVIDTQHKCPMCRAELQDTEVLVKPARDLGEEAPLQEPVDDSTSSKIEALLHILKASHQKQGAKVVLFSQWTSFLDIIQYHLGLHGYQYTRLDGSMSVRNRDIALQRFDEDASCTILLASLAVCSVGLNLVAANTVILSDSWWSPALEDQAVDRVHRLGQKRPTTVFRLVMEGSIEDRVIQIQQDKRKLMMLAFAEKAGKRMNSKSARLADVEKLLT
ncbi:MAG: hypothetical protein M1821_000384 [Bathelium mastoideum]|nr:MAG: hypothetical protein M1821_000384 [Bathelium mastoideum]KAI9686192.1 MAG: hypothetical protein M1822_003847 [Bathelium mastoideum]